MKITKIEAVYPSYKDSLRGWRPKLWQIITKVHTDKKSVFGYGTGGGGNASLQVINGHLSNFLIDQEVNDISEITYIFDKLFFESIPYGRGGIAAMAISSIDLAIWDAYSKYYETPIKNLLQDSSLHHNEIKTYATGNNVKHYNSLNIENYKLSIKSHGDYTAESVDLFESISKIREKYPHTKNIMIDCYMSWSAEYTKKMSNHLKDLDIEWIEDISTPDLMLEEKSITRDLNGIKLAGGEHDFNYNSFKIMKNNKTYNIWQPDVTWCGGISTILKIIKINNQEFKIILHRGGEPWGLPIIQSGLVDNLAELHNPKSIYLDLEQWNNNTIETIDEGILRPNEYLGFGAIPKKGIFDD